MPTYDYRCDTCGRTTEVFQKSREEQFAPCGACKGTLRRAISAPAVPVSGTYSFGASP